uniref:Uncharacterized protein n=1 Tax=Arundo donax TaxID=35708 RepID=A0A0A9FSK7_ARUDO
MKFVFFYFSSYKLDFKFKF